MDYYIYLGLMILVSSVIIYVVLNTYFRYHVSINRVHMISILLEILVIVNYIHLPLTMDFVWLSLMIIATTVLIGLYFKHKKISGFVLLNTTRKDYPLVMEFLQGLLKANEIPLNNLCYSIKKPFLVVIRGVDSIVVRKWMVQVDKLIQKQEKHLSMIQYVCFILGLLLLALLWRF